MNEWQLDFNEGWMAAQWGEEYDPYETEGWLAGWDNWWRDQEDEPDKSGLFLVLV